MVRFVKHILIVIGSVFVIANVVSFGSLWTLRQSQFYKPSFLIEGVQDEAFDYVIFGASTGLTTLSTHVIDSIAHTKGINLSIDDSHLSSQYLMLQHFLAEGKRTDYVILAPPNTSYDLNQDRLGTNDYRFLPYVGRDYVQAHFNRYSGTAAAALSHSQWLPVLGVSYYNTEVFFPSLVSLSQPEKHNRFDAYGNYTYPPRYVQDTPISSRTPFSVSFSNSYLKAIKALCEQYDMQLICYLSPMKSRVARLEPSAYSSINHSAFLTNSSYFFDGIHVNSYGREACSADFALQFTNLLKP